jgi:hypothetical protein
MFFQSYEEFESEYDGCGYYGDSGSYNHDTGCYEKLFIYDADTDELVHTFVWCYKTYYWVNPKGDNNVENIINTERTYLTNRLNEIERDKKHDLQRQYGLEDDKAPKTAAEFVDRIKKGLFVVRKPERFEEEGLYSATDAFSRSTRWRDPSVKEDKEGFKKAEEKLNKVFKEALDTIKILPSVDGLNALKDFETQSFK